MASELQINNKQNTTFQNRISRGRMKDRPQVYSVSNKEHDRLRKPNILTKTKIDIETALNTPGYAYRGMKGDPDFNFFEYLKVSKIPYYLGGIGLAAVTLGGRNNLISSAKKANTNVFKKMLIGVLLYYVARDVANAVINIPVKIFRGVDLNMPYRKITSMREGNPLNLPANKKPSNQGVFESCEFTRWDLLYKYDENSNMNETFDNLAKKFGAQKRLKDSDSSLMQKMRKLMIMATSWKYMLSVPFVTIGLGMAQKDSFAKTDFRSFLKTTIDLFKPSTNKRFLMWKDSFMNNLAKPLGNSLVELWKGESLTSKIIGRGAIISAVGLSILANAMILHKTSLKNDIPSKVEGGKQ